MSHFALNCEKYCGNFQHDESSFWKTDGGKNTSSSKFESGVTSVEGDECSDCPAVRKTDEKCGLNEGTFS
jgi:hypothetical protein